MPSLRIIPLTGDALETYYAQKAEEDHQSYADPTNCQNGCFPRDCSDIMHHESGMYHHTRDHDHCIQEPILDVIGTSSGIPSHASEHEDCDGRNDIHICCYKDKDRHENEDKENCHLSDGRLEEVPLLDKYANTGTPESHEYLASSSRDCWKRQNQGLCEEHYTNDIISKHGNITSIGKSYENTSSNKKRLIKLNHDYYEENELKNEGSPKTSQPTQPIPQSDMMASSIKGSAHGENNGQDTSSFLHSSCLSDESPEVSCDRTVTSRHHYFTSATTSEVFTKENESCTNLPSKPVQCNTAEIEYNAFKKVFSNNGNIFMKRFWELTAFKAKYGHCDVKTYGDDRLLGHWCSIVRRSKRMMDNNTRPIIRLSESNIRCLTEIGFKFGHVKMIPFDRYFEQLKAFKTKHGHCRVQICRGEDRNLGLWCARVRRSKKAMTNNGAPEIILSEDNIRDLTDLGFVWEATFVRMTSFDKHFKELEAFKAKHGHCNVKAIRGDKDRYLGLWCSKVRQSIHKLAKNERPFISGLSDENVKRLGDLGVNTKIRKRKLTSG